MYINPNKCFSFNKSFTTAVAVLSSFSCSEALIYNSGTDSVYIYDFDPTDTTRRFLLKANDTITIRGITNTDVLSAAAVSTTTTLYVRTAYFGALNPPN